MNKLITLELLMRYDEKLRQLVKSLPIDPELIEKETITKEKLDQAIQDAIDKAMSALQEEDIAGDREIIAQNKADADAKIADIEALIEAIENDIANNLANANSSIGEVNQRVNATNAAIAGLKAEKDTDVATLNSSLVSAQTAIEEMDGKITAIKSDVDAIDGLDELKTEVEGINQIVEALQTNELTTYVKKTDLEDGILTTMVNYNVLDGDTKDVKFYTKSETAAKIEESLGEYITGDELENYNYYNEEKTAEKVKEMMLSSDGTELNQGLLEKTAEFVQSQYTTYVDGKLDNYSTKAQTAQAITDIVGDIDVAADGTIAAQISTINQTAEGIESSVANIENDLVTNYSNTQQTADMIDSKVASYVDGELEAYSTTEQTATAITTEIGKIPLNNYYTKTETAEQIDTVLYAKNLTDDSGNTNVYTKTESADLVKTQLIDKGLLDEEGNTNVYTKTESADKTTTAIQSYVNDTLTNYSTTTQTADALKAHLVEVGLTDENESLLVVTPSEVESTVRDVKDELNGSIAQVRQTADSLTSTVALLSSDSGISSSTIAQLNDAIALCVKSEDLDGNEIINRISMDSTNTTIDGKYLHVTGATVFDDNVTIRGNMTSGSINCNGGVTISGGAVTMNQHGLTINNSNGSKMQLDQDGMNFYDSNSKKFGQIGRFAAGICQHGEVVNIGWDVKPSMVLLSPYIMKSSVAGNTANDMYIQCYATDITKDSFKAVCCTTVLGTKPSDPYTLAAENFSLDRTNDSSDYNNVTKEFTTAELTTPSSSTKTTLNGTIEFAATGTVPSGYFATATNGNITGLAGSKLTVTVTPNTGYTVSDAQISVASNGNDSSNNTYTATLGAHDNTTVVMTADRTGYDTVGVISAYIDVYVGSTKVNTLTAYNGTATASVKYPITNLTVSHSGGDKIKFVCRATWNYLSTQYNVIQGAITAVSQVSDPSNEAVHDEGTATYIALGCLVNE